MDEPLGWKGPEPTRHRAAANLLATMHYGLTQVSPPSIGAWDASVVVQMRLYIHAVM
jgi:hypothetical protein